MRSKLERICRFTYSAKQTGTKVGVTTANIVVPAAYKLHANHTLISGLDQT